MGLKDNLAVEQRFVDDKKVGITFNQLIDANGEEIVAEVFIIGSSTSVQVNADGFTTTGGLKDDEKTVVCDFSSLLPGDNYSLKFTTENSGVLARSGLVLYDEDAFSTQTLDVTDSPLQSQPLSSRLTEIANIDPDDNTFIVAKEDSTGWEGDSGATLRGRLGGASPSTTETGAYTLADSLFNVFTGTSQVTWIAPLVESFWLVANRSPNGSGILIDSLVADAVHNTDPFYIGPGEVRIVWSNRLNVFVI